MQVEPPLSGMLGTSRVSECQAFLIWENLTSLAEHPKMLPNWEPLECPVRAQNFRFENAKDFGMLWVQDSQAVIWENVVFKPGLLCTASQWPGCCDSPDVPSHPFNAPSLVPGDSESPFKLLLSCL